MIDTDEEVASRVCGEYHRPCREATREEFEAKLAEIQRHKPKIGPGIDAPRVSRTGEVHGEFDWYFEHGWSPNHRTIAAEFRIHGIGTDGRPTVTFWCYGYTPAMILSVYEIADTMLGEPVHKAGKDATPKKKDDDNAKTV